jgi:hypothetical protein
VVKNPFGDDPLPPLGPRNPFADDPDATPDSDPAGTLEHAAARIRRLKAQVGADGLTPSATRELIDHLTLALDVAARAIRKLS